MARGKSDPRANIVRLECGHIRNVVNKKPKPPLGEELYCMTCDKHSPIVSREIYD